MKSMIKKRTWRAIYRLLDHVSPIDGDCGKLCGAACCTCGDESAEDLGIYLYPGEDAIHSRKSDWLEWTVEDAEDYDFPDSWIGKVSMPYLSPLPVPFPGGSFGACL